MEMGLRDRVAVVSCGTVDIDLACAGSLHSEGARVVAGVPAGNASSAWDHVVGVPGRPDIDNLVDIAVERYGRVDVVVLGSTPASSDPIDAVDVSDLLGACDPIVEAVGTYQRALASMIPNAWGRFVHLASSSAKSVTDDIHDLDAMSGLAILALHKVVANEFGPHGITANAVLHSAAAPAADVAAAVTFLASERAAYLTGLAMTVDAGAGASIY